MENSTSTDVDKLITFGQMALEQGWYDQAREYFEQALALDTSNREAMKGLARVNEILNRRIPTPVEPTRAEPVEPPRKVERSKKKRSRSLESRLERYNITQAEFDRRKAELRKRWGQESSDTDVIWAILNDHTVEIARRGHLADGDLIDAKMNSRLKALLLHDIGKDPHELLQEAAKWDLMRMRQNPWVVAVQVSPEKDACSACQKLRDKQFTIDEALKKMPIPHKDCTFEHNGKRGWCRCLYVPVTMDSKEVVKQIRRQLGGK